VNEAECESAGSPDEGSAESLHAEPILIPAEALLDQPVEAQPAETPAISAAAPLPEAPPELVAPTRLSPSTPSTPTAKIKRKGRLLRGGLIAIALLLFIFPPALTLVYRIVPPPITMLMIERLVQGQGLAKHWRGLSDISPALPQAVIAAEDARFCEHRGFDFEAMREAAIHNERKPGKVRGGSTISQQTAKNVFLWPSRDYVRKGLEAWFTVLEEAIWGKRRILETYLNVVEWGPGIYGAQAAAQRYFHKDAKDLSPVEAARLAAVLPSPLKWKAVNPGRYVQRRSARIGAAAVTVREDDLAWCVRR
jgi:monofunctional biosynthetic peptidoglycan transglycosylase